MKLSNLFWTALAACTTCTQAKPVRRLSGLSPDQAAQLNARFNVHDAAYNTRYRPHKTKGPKYFHEPGRGGEIGHYDSRFWHKTILDYEQRNEILLHLTRAWLQMTNAEGIETWLAHGTLLGWWWNAKKLPWDNDIDVQVSEATLEILATKYNQTVFSYKSSDGTFEREYLLDVNPYWIERVRGDAQNMIDARFIDKTEGLYIDITGLSETHPDIRPNVVSCKNYHRYHIDDLYPLRDTLYEGVPAKVPFSFDKMLITEYKASALSLTVFEGHQWDPQTRKWIRFRDMPSYPVGQMPLQKRDGTQENAAPSPAPEIKRHFGNIIRRW